MATSINPDDVVVTLRTGRTPQSRENEIVVEGWSDSETAFTMPDVEPYTTITTTLGGRLHARAKKRISGDVGIEVDATSPFCQWVQARVSDRRQGEEVIIHGTVVNRRFGNVTNLRSGFIQSYRPSPSFGTRQSVMPTTIRFEDIQGDYSDFRPHLDESET